MSRPKIFQKKQEYRHLQLEDIWQTCEKRNIIPAVISIPVKVNRLVRAICGHFLAAKNYYEDECLIDRQLREYVIDDKLYPLENMSLLYWVYPYSTIVLMRDIVVKPYSNKYIFPAGIISIMSSFPVAYILSSEVENKCGLIDLFKYCNDDIDAVINVPIDCRSCYFPNTEHLRSFIWPCNVSGDVDGAMFLLGNDECMKESKIAVNLLKNINGMRNG